MKWKMEKRVFGELNKRLALENSQKFPIKIGQRDLSRT